MITQDKNQLDINQVVQAEYLRLCKPSVAYVYRKIIEYCEMHQVNKPTRATVYRIIDDLNTTHPDLVCLARDGRSEYIKKSGIELEKRKVFAFGIRNADGYLEFPNYTRYIGRHVYVLRDAVFDSTGRIIGVLKLNE